MVDYLEGVTTATPYRKTRDALLLQRLCRDAWAPLMDPAVPEPILEEIRVAAIRAALTLATDDESEVLKKFGYLGTCTSAKLRLSVGEHAHAYAHVDLGCSIGIPVRLVDHRSAMSVTPASYPRSACSLEVPVEVDDAIHGFFRERDAARRGYEIEMSRIVAVSRGVGAPATWGRMLDGIPVTRDHFAAESAKAPHDELMAA
jgi:hypothetical protein